MTPAPEGAPPAVRPVRLLVAIVLSSAVFLIVLSVAAFLARDAGTDIAATDPGSLAGGGPEARGGALSGSLDVTPAPPPGLSPEAAQAALYALEPVARRCLVESRRQDPGIGDDLALEVSVSIADGEGTLGAPLVPAGLSPFLRGCLVRALPRVRFPHDREGEGLLAVRVTPDGASLLPRHRAGAPAGDAGTTR